MNDLRTITALTLFCLLGNLLVSDSTQADEPTAASGFTTLFNGKSLKGWDGDPRFWRVEDGAIIGETTAKNTAERNTFLIHRGGDFGNFELRLSYQVEGYNSGLQYRSVDRGKWVVAGYQCDFEARWHKMKLQLKDIRVRRLSAPPALSEQPSPSTGASKTSTISAPRTTESSDKNIRRRYEQYALRHAGDPSSGRKLFDDKRTKCSVCHKVAGKGGEVGKDLSSIGGKFDRSHLIESLLEPSRQIVEGYRTTTVVTVDGKVINGILKAQSDEQITLVDANGKMQTISRKNIDKQTASTVSIMPDGLAKELSLEEFTDLIAYLERLRTGANGKMGSGVIGPIAIPDGFDLQTVATGLDGVTALEVLPDGRVLVCEQPGRVRVVENGKLLKKPFVSLPVDSYWERGVIGVTHDPEFPKKPYIYVCYVAKKPYPHHRVSRFTMKDNVAVEGSEKLLLAGDDQSKMGGKVPAGHQGGALHFGKDGKLYIGIGEQTSGMPAQKLDTFLGKILRINADGSIPRDNPFVDKTKGKYRAIWAYGARNPFTFAIRKSDGLMLINDVGGKSEEINVGRAGANYGWPVVDHGNLSQYKSKDYDGPIHSYKESSLNGGDFCATGNRWPRQWQGRYFFADYVQGWIHTLDPDKPADVNTFVEGIRRPVDMRFAPDGSLYVLLRNAWVIDGKFEGGTGSLLRIRPAGAAAAAAKNKSKSIGTTIKPAIPSIPHDLPAGKVLLHHEDDDHPDAFHQMDGKMTVCGFGRKGIESFHSTAGQQFSILLVESGAHDAALPQFFPR